MILIGVGNGWRGDDGAGLAVARRVRELAPAGVEVREVESDAQRAGRTLSARFRRPTNARL